jgi:4-amino-4-deoxy-L-arabinose transferase-like glycosyltransferase
LLTAAPSPSYDEGAYVGMAQSFLGRDPRPWVAHPPGYPAFLLPFVALGMPGLALARLAQTALGAALAPMTSRLAARLKFSPRESFAAGVLVALHPMLVFFSARLSSEIPFAVLELFFFSAWLGAWERGSSRGAAGAGFLGGLASLTRGVMLPFGGVLAAVAFWKRREQPRWMSLVIVCGSAWAATMAPWTIRNWARFHRFVPVSQQGGWNFYEGLTLDREEILWKRPAAMAREAKERGLKDIFETDAYFARKANAWIGMHPREFMVLLLRKAFKFWRLAPYPPHAAAARWGTGIFNLFFFTLAVLGLWRGALRHPGFAFILGFAVYLTLLHSVFVSDLRYRLPLEPLIAIAAGAGASVVSP